MGVAEGGFGAEEVIQGTHRPSFKRQDHSPVELSNGRISGRNETVADWVLSYRSPTMSFICGRNYRPFAATRQRHVSAPGAAQGRSALPRLTTTCVCFWSGFNRAPSHACRSHGRLILPRNMMSNRLLQAALARQR